MKWGIDPIGDGGPNGDNYTNEQKAKSWLDALLPPKEAGPATTKEEVFGNRS